MRGDPSQLIRPANPTPPFCQPQVHWCHPMRRTLRAIRPNSPSSEPAADSSQSETLHRRVSAIAGDPRRKKLTSILARRCPRCTDPLALLIVGLLLLVVSA